MKTILSILILVMLVSGCGSYNTIDSFYEAHKNDDQVTAVRVPRFMLGMLSNLSPELNAIIGNTKDIRYMQFPSTTPARTELLHNQMNGLTGTAFIEVFRKNDSDKRNVVAIRENKTTVKEILLYNNNGVHGSFLYFNGKFDPVKVRQLAKDDGFGKLSNGIISQLSTK